MYKLMQSIMWANKMFLIISILSSLAFCLEVGSKAHDPFKISDTISQFGKLAVGKGSRITLHRTEVNNGTEDGVAANLEGHQSDESGSAAWYKVAQTKLQLLNPSVLCGDDAMTLHVHGNRLPNFMVDRGEAGLVPLSRMPANCGFSVKRARRDVFIIAQYKGCHITQHGDSYVLPLRLWGAPVHMSCPMAPHVLPTVTCLSFGMVTKISGISTEALKLKVNGIWEPIMSASSACGFTTEAVTDGVAIVAPFRGSCWQVKDGEKLLYLLGEDEELTLSCHDQDPNGYDPNVAPTTGGIATIPDAPDLVFDKVVTKSPPTKSLLASTPSTYAAAVVPANEHPPVYPFPPMYYPFGHVYSHQPVHFGSHWVSMTEAPTTAISVLTEPVLATRATPPVAPLLKTTQTSPSPSVRTPVPTSAVPTRNPQQLEYPLPQMEYPSGPMYHHCKLCPYGHPCAFTEEPTTPEPATPAPTIPASNLKQPMYPFPQVHYPYGYMRNHHRPPFYKNHPWAPPTNVQEAAPSITETVASDAFSHKFQRPVYPFPQTYPFAHNQYIKYHAPWLY